MRGTWAVGLWLLLLVAGGRAPAAPVETTAGPWRGEGRVVAVDRTRGWLTLEHGPIGELVRAGRTEFPVREPGPPAAVRVGDAVSFVLAADPDGHGVLSLSEVRGLDAERPPAASARAVADAATAVILLALAAVAAGFGLGYRRLRRRVARDGADLDRLRGQLRHQQDALAGVEREATALSDLVRRQQAILRQASSRLQAALTEPGPDPAPVSPSAGATRPVVIVRRGETATFRSLDERLGKSGAATIAWDRRKAERRTSARLGRVERRRRERRGPTPVTWDHLGYLFVEPPAGRVSRVA